MGQTRRSKFGPETATEQEAVEWAKLISQIPDGEIIRTLISDASQGIFYLATCQRDCKAGLSRLTV